MASGWSNSSCTPVTANGRTGRFAQTILTEDELLAIRIHASVNGLRQQVQSSLRKSHPEQGGGAETKGPAEAREAVANGRDREGTLP